MTKYQVKFLRAGVSFTKPVYIDPTNMLAGANEIISQSDLDRLNKWKIEEVMSAGEPVYSNKKDEAVMLDNQQKAEIEAVRKDLKSLFKLKPRFNAITQSTEAVLKNFYERVIADNNPQANDVRTKAEEIADFVMDNPLAVIFLPEYAVDLNIYSHVIACAFYATRLGVALDFSRPKIMELVYSILMMDVGMLKVPATIMDKAEKLSEAEKQIIHSHPVHGYQLLTQVAKVKNTLATVALQHHEHFDGTGYPRKIKGAEMSEFSRVAAIVTSFCAIISKKPYRKGRLPYEAMKELLTMGIYRYDPVYLKTFLDSHAIYPIGSVIEMSDSSIGLVCFAVRGKPMRPIVLILRNSKGIRPSKPEFYHLIYEGDKFISKARYPDEAGITLDEEYQNLLNQA